MAGETPTQRRLAEHAATNSMTTSQVLRTLEAKGLVKRSASPDDSRARRRSVTPKEAAMARHAIAVVEAADGEFFATAGKRTALLRTLHRLATVP